MSFKKNSELRTHCDEMFRFFLIEANNDIGTYVLNLKFIIWSVFVVTSLSRIKKCVKNIVNSSLTSYEMYGKSFNDF